MLTGTAGAQTGEADLIAAAPVVAPAPRAGGTSTYAIDVSNAGPDATTNVRIQTNFNLSGDDSLLTLSGASVTGGTCNIAGPRAVVCNVGALGIGQTAAVSITFSLAPSAAGAITVNGTITSDLLDPDPDNFSSTGPLAIDPPPTTVPPPTAVPTTVPTTVAPTTTVVPELPRPPAARVPAATPVPLATTPAVTRLPSTGPPSRGVVWVGVAGLAGGFALLALGRQRRAGER